MKSRGRWTVVVALLLFVLVLLLVLSNSGEPALPPSEPDDRLEPVDTPPERPPVLPADTPSIADDASHPTSPPPVVSEREPPAGPTETFEISGTVVEVGGGTPPAGILLGVSLAGEVRAKEVGRAKSTEDGRFTFSGLKAGEYVLRVGSRNPPYDEGPTAEYVPVVAGPVSAGDRDVVVTLTPGLSITGRIEDHQGASVKERVGISVVGITADGTFDPLMRRSTWSSPDGSFQVRGLSEGAYRLTFEPLAGAKEGVGITMLENVRAGTRDLRVRMTRGVVMKGRLEDENGNPVAGLGYIFIYPTGTHPAEGGAVSLPVRADGTFETVPLDPAQSYDILATGFPGHSAGQVEGALPGTPDLVVVLKRALSIIGKVVDEDGQPVPDGVGVHAIAPDAPDGSSGRRATAYTRVGGVFALEGLGDYRFRVRAGGARSIYQAGEAAEDVQPNGEPIVLEVKKGVTFSGRLVDRRGEPVITNLIRASQADDAISPSGAVRDEQGNFTITGLKPGKLTLSAYLGSIYVDLGEFTAPAAGVEVVVPDR